MVSVGSQLIDRFSRLVPGFNRRSLALDDLYGLCDIHNIDVVHLPLRRVHGIAFEEDSYRCMYINRLLRIPFQIIAGFHEFCHFDYHTVDSRVCLSMGGLANLSKRERQAQAVGVVALMPAPLIVDMTVDDLMREFEVSRQIAEFRASLCL